MVKRGSTERLRLGGFTGRQSRSEPGLRVTRSAGGNGLAVVGEVDLATHRDWQHMVTLLLVDDVPAWLDLSGLSFIDGHGAAVLVSVAQEMAPERSLTLYRPPLCLRRLLDLFWPGRIVIVDEEAG